MISIEPPSFSLGFDLDAASGFEPEPGLTVSDSDLELEPGFSSPVLKRLRRGINNSCAKDDRCKEEDRDDEDIEEFSSPDDFPAADAPTSTRSRFSSCSSSRVSLHGSGVFTNQPSSISRSREKRKRLDVPTTSGISSVESLFQRSTCSPLRRFQLLDSDSEDNDHPSTSRVTKTNDSFSKDQPSVASKPKRKESESMQCTGDLWKDFSPAAISKIQTPALDDVCQDYFSSIKMSSTAQKQCSVVATSSNSGFCQQTRQSLDFSHPSPPSHRFFMHSDPRIQNLARQRLPNFLPLGIFNDKEVFFVDYMNQFGSKESSKTGDSSSKICRRVQKKSKVSKGQERSKAAPKDAGKRSVSANTGSAGHWFTSPEGRKVYISKSGQEFSGQSAYRCYRKETGGGFNKSKKKRQPKKKAEN